MKTIPFQLAAPSTGRGHPTWRRVHRALGGVCLAAAALPLAALAAPATRVAAAVGTLADIRPGAPGATGRAEHAETVGSAHPALRVASVRASSFREGHEPYRALDGQSGSDWRFSGPPPAPMVRGQWLEVELSEVARVDHVQVQWLCDKPCRYTVYRKMRDDFREPLLSGVSEPGQALQTLRLNEPTMARAVRVEIEPDAQGAEQGIREMRVGGVPYPQGYPLAADRWAQPEPQRRILYVEFERVPYVTTFNMGLPTADGGQALRLLPRDDAFEGGHYEFELATKPGRDNWVMVQQWEAWAQPQPASGNTLVLEARDGDARQRGRSFVPAWVSEQRLHQPEWWGGEKPAAGHWAWVHFRLPAEWVGTRTRVQLRLQAVANLRRDQPMTRPSAPIYRIVHALTPVLPAP